MFKMNNKSGFSLIELMIVVAIIGILASVAIPNFQSFIRRSKQAEAKTNLSTIYAGQRAFHGEWSFFYGAFEHIGYSPEGDLRYNIETKLYTGGASALYMARKGTQVTADKGASVNTATFCGTAYGNCFPDPATQGTITATLVSDEDAFLASAAADLGGVAEDEWTINEAKVVSQVSVGE